MAPPPGNLGSARGGYLVAEHLGTEGVSYEDGNPADTCHKTLGRSEAQSVLPLGIQGQQDLAYSLVPEVWPPALADNATVVPSHPVYGTLPLIQSP